RGHQRKQSESVSAGERRGRVQRTRGRGVSGGDFRGHDHVLRHLPATAIEGKAPFSGTQATLVLAWRLVIGILVAAKRGPWNVGLFGERLLDASRGRQRCGDCSHNRSDLDGGKR